MVESVLLALAGNTGKFENRKGYARQAA